MSSNMSSSTSMLKCLQNKTVFVTGCTGFLAKIFVEKLLRLGVKRLFVLLRSKDAASAHKRLQEEVLRKEVFDILRMIYGNGFESFVGDKIKAVGGDVSDEDNLGINDKKVEEEIWEQTNVIVHVAASTKFDERYDVAMGANTMGAKHVLNFAKNCPKLEVLLHVSTAYVAGEKAGLIMEEPFSMGETLNGKNNLDIEVEKRLVIEKLEELRSKQVSKEEERFAMKQFGLERARHFGWPNTYVFTKSMGEMLITKMKGSLPLLILRPTMIISTIEEPFPGWIEGTRTVDILLDHYGKGKLKFTVGDPNTILDFIPGDMVVNAMLALILAQPNQSSKLVYHMGSSLRNPIKYSLIHEYAFNYFSSTPCKAKDNSIIKVRKGKVFTTMSSFRRFINVRYRIPLQVLRIAEGVGLFRQNLYPRQSRMLGSVMHLFNLYRPYIFFKGKFDDVNMQKLRAITKMCDDKSEKLELNFDPKCIDWKDYLVNVHMPGLVRHTF